MRSDVAGRRRKSTTIKINYININVPPAINVSVGRWTAAELKVIWHTHTTTHTFTHRNPQPTTQVDNNEYLIKWPERYLAPFKFREWKAAKNGEETRAKTRLWAKFTFVLRPRSACYRSSYCCCSPSACCCCTEFHFNYQHECGQNPRFVS